MGRQTMAMTMTIAALALGLCACDGNGQTSTTSGSLDSYARYCAAQSVCTGTKSLSSCLRNFLDDAEDAIVGYGPGLDLSKHISGFSSCDEYWMATMHTNLESCDPLTMQFRCEGSIGVGCEQGPDGRQVTVRRDCAADQRRVGTDLRALLLRAVGTTRPTDRPFAIRSGGRPLCPPLPAWLRRLGTVPALVAGTAKAGSLGACCACFCCQTSPTLPIYSDEKRPEMETDRPSPVERSPPTHEPR